MKKKRVAILGSTGSIGLNALKVIERLEDHFEVVTLSAFNNVDTLVGQIKKFWPRNVALSSERIPELRRLFGKRVKFFDVAEDLPHLASAKEVDVVILAVTGAAALGPFLSAAQAGKVIAPANKEALVMAGDVIVSEARRAGASIVPVDSEQSAIFQCLAGQDRAFLKKVHLTASGGALRKVAASRHDRLSVREILRHPRWRMGAKITVDSATLMNKGFEVIEAMRLFGLSVEEVNVVIHPEAIIHSMVEMVDGALLAQLGLPDMRLPIQYALTYPQRLPTGLRPLDLTEFKSLTFEKPDTGKFPALALAYYAARKGGTLPAVLNAADEVAVEAFLKGRIRFTDIFRIAEKVVMAHKTVSSASLEDIRYADACARFNAVAAIKVIE
ncbi:MAG: 1-deoxy-D-xylulose-5-phosphate reductoisomerase [Candidatus Omnitrophica bacterium]|nr:1-deoxy-D-xylulose-5-phosphate reductoisomerase [Candidatus Omnitrophota bacterium]